MKKKKLIYFVLPLILLVWGFVFSQLYSYIFSEPSYVVSTQIEPINIDEIKKDTFSIVADYRDPFLGKKIKYKYQYNSSSSGNASAKSKQKKEPIAVDKSWPTIVYNGMIKNKNSNRRVGLVKVNGKEFLIREKDVVAEVTILAITKHSVQVRFRKEKKTIIK